MFSESANNGNRKFQLTFTSFYGVLEFLKKESPLSRYEKKVQGIRNFELFVHLQANNPELFPESSKNALFSLKDIERVLIQKVIYDKGTRKNNVQYCLRQGEKLM